MATLITTIPVAWRSWTDFVGEERFVGRWVRQTIEPNFLADCCWEESEIVVRWPFESCCLEDWSLEERDTVVHLPSE